MRRRTRTGEAGFTLIEALLATLLMTVILAGLATITAQWLPNWNRGLVRVQRAERLAIGIDRIVADLSVAEMIPPNSETRVSLFEGNALSLTFVRTSVGPNSRPGLEIIRLIEKADSQGLALVRERALFAPMPSDAQLRFADQVVLTRAPFRISFSYAGVDRVWQPTWRDQMQLPEMIRITVRDGTAQVLAIFTVAMHVNAPAECARAKNPPTCLIARVRPELQKKGEQL
jgi:general secretion pathway protein J